MASVRLFRKRAALACAACLSLKGAPAHAQNEEALAAARKTFAEGVADENAKRYEAALEEFRRVAAVRVTANVRYRIASCLEALGRRAEALATYEGAARIGEGDPTATDAVRESRDRAAELDRTVARLAITFSTPPPVGTQVRVDDAPVNPQALANPIRLDPGPHSIAVTAPGAPPFHTGVTLLEGSRVTLAVDLAPLPTAEVALEGTSAVPSSRSAPVGGYVAFGIGGALALGSVASFVLRASNVSTLNVACYSLHGDTGTLHCPLSRESELNGVHTAAAIEGPLGVGLGVGAAIAAGLGVWLVMGPPSRENAAAADPAWPRVGPMLVPHGGGVLMSAGL
jgi:hypothetical protein